MTRYLPRLIAALCLLSGGAYAQGEGGGIDVPVNPSDVALIQLAVPNAVNLGDVPDTRGITEALSGTVIRDLQISGHFNFIPRGAYLVDPAKEGLEPDFKAWFNAGTQGLIKIGYRIEGQRVSVDMRLFSVDGNERITLPAPYQAAAALPVDLPQLRAHAHGFVNEVLRYYTKSPGFFLSKIVFVKRLKRGKAIYTVSPDGYDEARITQGDSINMLPSWRGGRIYFTSFRNGGVHLFTYSGGHVRPFAAYEGLNTGAKLSPDGKTIACTLSKDGNPEIYLLNGATGEVIKRLTNHWGIDTSPTWSPDGQRIAFVSDRHGTPQIWVMDAGGGNQKRLTFQGEYNQTPAWSPRGDKIAFTARDERNVFDIFTVAVADGALERLTQNQGNNEQPSWSPDGRYLVFSSTRNGESKLYITNADGRVQTQISTGKGEYLTPFWQR
ncbi:DPP IV N-terminal domain-containing protein [Myxococcota bacterium]|nr:DPP IV N-terminal domain-containing protein [Myxococcota bacterium]MBU1431440.1 DPP IV N-terminal domain-containing protein [Myxococcota bacterium]MBU1899115.1 DPP IV N-terminal domain-containing protein [Myxococcota bacterium]